MLDVKLSKLNPSQPDLFDFYKERIF